MVFTNRGSIKASDRMFSNTLWMEFDVGEFGMRGTGGGVSTVVGSGDECEDLSVCVSPQCECLSFSVCVCLSQCVCVSFSVCLTMSLSLSHCVCLYLSVCVSLRV